MRLLKLGFEIPLQHRDIAGFRASVAAAAGFEEDLFHNHRSDGSVQYRYPKIQYRSQRGKAMVVAVDDGCDTLISWFGRADKSLLWNGEKHPIRIDKLDLKDYEMQFAEQPQVYRLSHWLALNQKNYSSWNNICDTKEQMNKLEGILVANILTFCRAVNWYLPQRLEVEVLEICSMRKTSLHGVPLIGFDIVFSSNLVLPHEIGLGKGVSHGYGVCRAAKRHAHEG